MRLPKIFNPLSHYKDEEDDEMEMTSNNSVEEPQRSLPDRMPQRPQSIHIERPASQVPRFDPDLFGNGSERVRIVHPKNYDQSSMVANSIKDRKIVILDMNEMQKSTPEQARETIQFIYGVCFALDIAVSSVRDNVYMIDPDNRIQS